MIGARVDIDEEVKEGQHRANQVIEFITKHLIYLDGTAKATFEEELFSFIEKLKDHDRC